jgi:nucleoside-diphosphate-sugar epimerase
VRLRLLPIPYLAARAGLGLFGLLAPLVVGARLNAVTAASLDFLSRDNPFTSERARRELGWAPPVRPEAGVTEAFRWWAGHH